MDLAHKATRSLHDALPISTGNLDSRTSEHVFGTLAQLVRASRLAAIVATHNMDLAERMDRRVTIREGLLVELSRSEEHTSELQSHSELVCRLILKKEKKML